ncbi:alpha/beta hydrolase [Patulibacter defluvii]|uniref:alpha/beta hydrolase n=1 Tax=Patulibacter defluvii TaxID=3095358 RepID=UPI002A7593AC|nr:alpha/beta hydrolase [Patulibacter sp. DM4]
MRRRTLLLAPLVAALSLPLSAASADAVPRLRVDGGSSARATACGTSTTVRRVATGGALRVTVPAARTGWSRAKRRGAAVVVERCRDGRWRPDRSLPLARGGRPLEQALPTTGAAADGDLRIRSRDRDGRLGRPAYVRVGVGEIVDLPISFRVVNRNRTAIPCLAAPDGRGYVVHANLVAPRSVLDAGAPAVTLYLHGLGYSGELFFRFRDVPGYDYGMQQAQAGHASVILDRLGNPAHDELRDGNATCIPAQADMADQVIRALRDGRVDGLPGAPRFRRVLLAGHSLGGFITQITQYSFNSADAIAVIGYTDVPSVLALGTFANAALDCTLAPRKAHGGTGAPNYAPFGRTAADFASGHFHDIDPAVAQAVLARRNLDACGDLMSALQSLVVDHLGTRLGISSPVLVISGANDALFPPPTNGLQALTGYLRSPDVSLVELPSTGHAVTLGRTHEAFRAAIDRWLRAHGA